MDHPEVVEVHPEHALVFRACEREQYETRASYQTAVYVLENMDRIKHDEDFLLVFRVGVENALRVTAVCAGRFVLSLVGPVIVSCDRHDFKSQHGQTLQHLVEYLADIRSFGVWHWVQAHHILVVTGHRV